MRILMVCLGNICRSPLAEGILRKKIAEHGLNWEVDSAGTGGWHIGEPPDRRSIKVARSHGLDISQQKARKFQASDLEAFDVILAMDSTNYQDIIRMASSEDQEEKVELILNISTPGRNQSVPDPYWDDDGFEFVYTMLEEACEKVVEHYQA